MNTYPRETVEFQPVTVKVDGAEVTTGVQLALTTRGERPTAWTAPTVIDGKVGVMVQGLDPGTYHVWAKVASSPETPVVDCGAFSVT